jgi:hypothetical protein
MLEKQAESFASKDTVNAWNVLLHIKKCCSLFNGDDPAKVNQEIAAFIEQH